MEDSERELTAWVKGCVIRKEWGESEVPIKMTIDTIELDGDHRAAVTRLRIREPGCGVWTYPKPEDAEVVKSVAVLAFAKWAGVPSGDIEMPFVTESVPN